MSVVYVVYLQFPVPPLTGSSPWTKTISIIISVTPVVPPHWGDFRHFLHTTRRKLDVFHYNHTANTPLALTKEGKNLMREGWRGGVNFLAAEVAAYVHIITIFTGWDVKNWPLIGSEWSKI